jgi:hypothetical protein
MTLKSTDGYMKIRAGHTRPIDFTLKRDGTAVDISGASAKVVRGRIQGVAATKFEVALAFVDDGTDGVVRYTPGATDLDTANVMYELEFKITMADGKEFPPDLFTIYAEEALTAVPAP